jgi:hypothetical protein
MTVAADHPWTVAGRRDGSRSRLYAILKALGDDGALHLDITPGSVLLAATVTLATEQQPDSPMLIARLPRLAMAGRGAGFDVDLSGAELILPHAGFAAEDVSASLSRTAEAGLAASLTVSTLRSTADPPMLVPMHLDAAANAALGGPIDLTATLSDESGRLSAEARGRHDPATHSGSLSIQVKPLTLGPDGAALTSVSPALASRISGLAGTITLDGSVEWGARAAPGRARLKIEDLSVEAGGIAARGVSGVLTARKLLPPVLPPGQTVTIAALDGGLPLSNGVIRFGLDGNRLKVERAEFHSAAGMLFITPTETDLSSAEQRITLEADGLELAQLLALAKVEGLSATGTLSGRLPLILHDGTATLEGGRLTAMTPGRLAYDPAEPPSFLAGEPGSGLALLRTALTDFRYETLALAMDGTLGGDLAVGLTLRGANPGFYDGHPVALNLKLSGALDTILRNGIQLGSIPDTIREKIEDVAPHDQQQ